MKKQPEIMPFKVPEHVRVNMHNGQDYVPVPLSNLDEAEVEKLCIDFCLSVYAEAGLPSREMSLVSLADEAESSTLMDELRDELRDEPLYFGFPPDRKIRNL